MSMQSSGRRSGASVAPSGAATTAAAASALGRSVSAGVLGRATVAGGLACVFYGPAAAPPSLAREKQLGAAVLPNI